MMMARNPHMIKKTLGVVYGTMCSGIGHQSLSRVTTSLGLKYLSKNQYHKYKKLICEMAKKVCDDHLKTVVKAIYSYYEHVLHLLPEPDKILNITVSFDGSWKTRGFISNKGCVQVICAHTGHVIDYVSFCKNCVQCKKKENLHKKGKWSTTRYNTWRRNHKKIAR